MRAAATPKKVACGKFLATDRRRLQSIRKYKGNCFANGKRELCNYSAWIMFNPEKAFWQKQLTTPRWKKVTLPWGISIKTQDFSIIRNVTLKTAKPRRAIGLSKSI